MNYAVIQSNISQLEVNSFATASKDQRYIVSYHNRHYEVTQSVADLISVLQDSRTIDEAVNLLSSKTGKHFSRENITEMISLFIAPILRSENIRASPFYFNRQIISANAIEPLTNLFRHLFRPYISIPLLISALALQVYFLSHSTLEFHSGFYSGFGSILTYAGLLFASILFHELGHASACRYYDVSHGHIGVGLYLHLPVLYADVSNIWKLKRHQRIVVDFAGIYFQMLFLVPVILYFEFYEPAIVLQYLIYTIIITFLFDLNPFFKCDGYWIWSDLLGVPNFRARTLEIIVYAVNWARGRSLQETPYLFRIRPLEQLGLVLYTILVNIFFSYYLLYRVPVFICNASLSVPAAINQMVTSGNYTFNILIPIVLQILMTLLMLHAVIRLSISTSKFLHKLI